MYKEVKTDWYKHLDFIIADIISIQVAYIVAYIIRNGFGLPYSDSVYQSIGILFILISLCSILYMEGYKHVLKRGSLKELKQVILYVTSIILITTSIIFMDKSLRIFSRAVLIETWAISILLTFSTRLWLKKIIKTNHMQKRVKREVVVITARRLACEIITKIQTHEYVDFNLSGIILLDCDLRGEMISGIPVVSDQEGAIRYLKDHVVDEIFLSLPREMELPEDIIQACKEMGITKHLNLMSLADNLDNKVIEKFAGYTVITNSLKLASPKQLFIKRTLDILGGLVGVLFTGIITLFVAPIIFLQSPGPIFFSQVRVGKNGRKFKIYKFRSMYLDAEARKVELMQLNEINGLMFKMKDDPRIIPFGNFIRDYSIDELPQLLNVLKGEMSLVGTRPPTVDEYEQYQIHHRKRLAAKPGLTGMWQVSGRSGIKDFEDVVELDAKYIKEWSIGLDLKILVKTIGVVFGKKGAS